MNAYRPNPAETTFLLFDVLRLPQQLAELPALAEVADPALMQQVLEEAGKFVGEVVAPLNRDGDEIGCRFEAGTVTAPPGFADAYRAFWQAGWPALATATEDGGQGLPSVLEAVLYEWLSAANHGWTMAPGLLHGAYECVKHHASDALKAQYLEKLATGEWLATMCLTEPHAGSDLGLVRTKAVPQPDGGYLLSGTKIFISGGEHDLSENIVHLVLARLPDAPAGPKGLSLFLVPKFYTDGSGHSAGPSQARPAPSGGSAPHEVGSVGAWVRSAVVCERIEEKMGLHGSPTCVMRFDEAHAQIVGEPGRGLNAMFVMMNAARLHVALQGVGLLDAAWQKANAYAAERRQMRAPGPRVDGEAADLIHRHPAMRQKLDTQRAWVDAGRVLAYRTALELDVAKHHPDAARRASAQRWCALTTPVLKSAFTEQAFSGGSECLQVFGGHGYVREWGIEQIVRDARVSMIYEGTNEIQAIDLLLRKVLPDGGTALNQLLDELGEGLRISALRDMAQTVVKAAPSSETLAHEVAGDFLRATALVLLDWAWQQIENAAPTDDERWQRPALALHQRVLPEFEMRRQMVLARCAQ
ncbi:acyl-CoA dehydrogenase family protein [Hydrogenophaga atypica]|uniref:Acyl-CoA dehydrogenase family protein n=1 Tax=Hydrogenophaga atypica TaxID=249409 RepID=A0ABW2QM75_9BURK